MDIEIKYLTVKQVAELLQVHENTVYRWLEAGTLRGSMIGDSWRIQQSDIDELFSKKPASK